MSVPLLFVLLGVFFLFYNAGWSFNFDLSLGFIWPMFAIVIGLLLFLKRKE